VAGRTAMTSTTGSTRNALFARAETPNCPISNSQARLIGSFGVGSRAL
jgi:hypothetical protein